ncbi:beta-hydroxyacid dehydrogenase, 3-hydroxyisobutyrate dehydrogenase [Gracilibacillus halophilus YIM-C55.5]|uniref:Beta-hydroxyacid dehydrogenase, 3-hydroxyisobutyrate dehydrogenase n=1 Tax=Gracilibacillus halophilus YIM-C55.5 TaxID=1308866 RepID=N4WAS9_9BACI|nr:NAD(P)-dependent oxidoreductase [Gracilibacillus halophilus]ENH96369.1 beta-hydroxyacid dehydrogenase, 3-hydroxyisobutyrate dehydrogenase [Gracilibacillus halophilus YIM-C55.5]
MTQATTIGFIGTGVMGKSMCQHLLDAGYTVNVYTRTKSKAQALVTAGANWKDSVKEIATDSDVIITIVGFPSDVEEVYFGEKGIIEQAKTGSYLIDMTTSDPMLAETIAQKGKEKGLHSLDAPVSGGDVGAKNGSLTIMVGGQQDDYQAMLPIFNRLGSNVIRQGEAGAGQHTKMANQITIASNMIGVSEAIMYAKKSGLDPSSVLESISQGAAGSWSLRNLAPRMTEGDDRPGFYIKHFIKDMTIALSSAKRMGLLTPGLELSLELYQELEKRGEADSGTQALIKWYQTNVRHRD